MAQAFDRNRVTITDSYREYQMLSFLGNAGADGVLFFVCVWNDSEQVFWFSHSAVPGRPNFRHISLEKSSNLMNNTVRVPPPFPEISETPSYFVHVLLFKTINILAGVIIALR